MEVVIKLCLSVPTGFHKRLGSNFHILIMSCAIKLFTACAIRIGLVHNLYDSDLFYSLNESITNLNQTMYVANQTL